MDKNLSLQKLNIAIKAVENLYVDTINSENLIENTIVSLLQKLDPYSNYLTSDEVKEMNKLLQGNFDGIGIQFNILTDTLYVVHVIPKSPSEKVGIMVGDRIVAINDTSVAGMKNIDIIKRLQGLKGTSVNIKVIRTNNPRAITFKIVRDKIPIYTLDTFYMINKKTGYVKLNCFGLTTCNEFEEALKELQKKGLKNLIVDLQDNGGGYLQSAIDIATQFLRKNDLIVYIRGFHQKQENAYAIINGSFLNGKIVILINEFAASASEIVAGALQDWDRAVIIGRRSFGKGLVQRPIIFPDGSMIKLTTARYYTPTGRSIQKNYKNEDKEFYEKNSIKHYNNKKMLIANHLHIYDSLKYRTLLNKRVVYGGGGIMPDYFIQTDTSLYTNIYYSLLNSGALSKFIINYMDKNRIFLHYTYKCFYMYKLHFHVSNTLLNNLLKMLKQENFGIINDTMCFNFKSFRRNNNKKHLKCKKNKISTLLTAEYTKQFEKSKPLIKLQIKALIARNLWGMNEYYQIINDKNDALQKAVEIIENNEMYNKLIGKLK